MGGQLERLAGGWRGGGRSVRFPVGHSDTLTDTGAVIGAQIGVVATQYFTGPKIRLAFVPLPLIGAGIVIYTLVTGHKF